MRILVHRIWSKEWPLQSIAIVIVMLKEFFVHKIEEEVIDNIWFQQNGDTCHTATLDVLSPVVENRVISHRADVVWPTPELRFNTDGL